ncbi:hypothetical protein HKCCE2091_12990 [Rhodobacterales bacterium HKCCE2091]|nr:hypothetical protein [Rhodobacterales bacterium HKCCE2091]
MTIRLASVALALAAVAGAWWQGTNPRSGGAAALPPMTGAALHLAAPAPEHAPVIAARLPDLPPLPARFGTDVPAATPSLPDEVSRYGLPCGLVVGAAPEPPAMVRLTVADPCNADAAIRVEHAGLSFTLRTDLMGRAEALLPVLTDPAAIRLTLPGGATREIAADAPDLADYDRAAVTWSGASGVELHARERGAVRGGAGHVRPAAPGSPGAAMRGEGGFLTALGTQGAAQTLVYTFPRDTLPGEGGVVRLSVEVPVDAGNCGTAVEAGTVATTRDGDLAQSRVAFTLPGCAEAGQVMVLQNLFGDLRIAAN